MSVRATTIRWNHDDLCVCTACLGTILRAWVAKWDADHPVEPAWTNRYVAPRTPGWRKDKLSLAFLSDEIGVGVRQLQRILSCDQATTSLSLADNLLCAIDRTYEMQTLTVYKRIQNRRLPGYYGHGHVCELGVLEVAA